MQFYYVDGQLESPDYVRGFLLGYSDDETTADIYMSMLEANTPLLLGSTAIIASDCNLTTNQLYSS